MNILKSVIHDTKTNSVEATWVDEISPAVEVPESIAPDTIDADGNVVPGIVTPAHTIPAVQVPIKCHSYADVQMDMFRADVQTLGGDIAEHEAMIATVEAAIVPYVAPPPVIPVVVSMRRARLALLGAGLLDSVNTAVAGMAGVDGEAARIEWEYATEVDRNSPLVVGLAAILALTPAQLDDLFTTAGHL